MESRLEQNTVSIEKCLQLFKTQEIIIIIFVFVWCFFILMIYWGFFIRGGGIGCSKGANSVQKQFLFHFEQHWVSPFWFAEKACTIKNDDL